MPIFPKTEAGIIALAQQVEGGLNNNLKLSDSPVAKEDFTAMLSAFLAKRDSIIVKEAGLGVDYDEKEDLLDDLTEAMKRVIDFLDSKTGGDPTELASIGWGTSSTPTKQPPGQPRTLEIISETDANLFLDWKSAIDGGRAASYRVERRERPSGAWETCGATNVTEIHLTNQPRGIELEWRVIGFNSNGDSVPSNTVAATL